MNHLVRVSIGVSLILAAVIAAQIGSAAPVDDSAFRRTWERTDQPVKDGAVSRTWMWGPVVSGLVQEDYAQSPDGHRVVWYFDKSRMEITHLGVTSITRGTSRMDCSRRS